ncbi:vanin-like protein 1 [Hyposmocoma kahamanoa]|uniref:vanin-like protein 1 n=1 Tax=Hyposmocoma kahamanoa TaxID=1477025 RepID=UPI000E6D9403|nr:vanin-like protein 1 [Hyposmocoma kahamanoa]
MKCLINLVICSLCINLTLSVKDTYRAAVVVDPPKTVDLGRYVSFIQDAAKSKADILVLPSPEKPNYGEEYYDEAVKTLSEAAKENKIYVVAHLYEETRCHGESEVVRNNLVFDRRGAVIVVYRKPLNKRANCTTSPSEIIEFTTDFGVTFGLMMEEDLVLKKPRSLKNYIVAGEWRSEIPFLSASQFSSSWAYVTNANLVFSGGIYAGKAGLKSGSGKMSVVELHKNCDSGETIAPVVPPTKSYPSEDALHLYAVKAVNVEVSLRGYTETVCHDELCCEFYIKSDFIGSTPSEVSYGLAAFNGARHFGVHYHIGAQSCAVFAYKPGGITGSESNSTNLHFEKITVTGNFSGPNKSQFPIILSSAKNDILSTKFKFETSQMSQKMTIEASDGDILSFGIFGRDFSKDFESENIRQVNSEGLTWDVYEYLYNEDVQEFFDYVWIRLRIMLVIVSIYILEMM